MPIFLPGVNHDISWTDFLGLPTNEESIHSPP